MGVRPGILGKPRKQKSPADLGEGQGELCSCCAVRGTWQSLAWVFPLLISEWSRGGGGMVLREGCELPYDSHQRTGSARPTELVTGTLLGRMEVRFGAGLHS